MENSIGFMILLQIILIGLNAVFACAEIAIISMNDSKLEKMAAAGDVRAMRLLHLTSQPAKFLATIQVAITLSGFLGSAFAAENFSGTLVDWLVGLGIAIPVKTLDTLAVVFITIILSYFTLVFGELVPKRVAMGRSESLALSMSALISAIAKMFAPVVWFLTISTNGILRLVGIDPNAEAENVSEEEIRMMVDVGSEKGTIDHQEKVLIQNVFEFDDLCAEEIATHRTEVDLLWLEETPDEWERVIHESRHTLYPVCSDNPDNIVGILNAKDYFRLNSDSRAIIVEQAVRKPYFVPKSVKADVLFSNMKRDRVKMAVVLDEYGGMIGIVTMNDLVEQLVGELCDDEQEETEEKMIESIGEKTWKIQGRASLTDVARELGVVIDTEEHDTFNGLVFSVLGTVPQDGTCVELETDNLTINVEEISEHQVKTAIVTLKEVG